MTTEYGAEFVLSLHLKHFVLHFFFKKKIWYFLNKHNIVVLREETNMNAQHVTEAHDCWGWSLCLLKLHQRNR